MAGEEAEGREVKIEHYVEYLYPDILFGETCKVKLERGGATEAVDLMHPNSDGFRLFDVEIRTGTLEDGSPVEDRREVNHSAWYYPDGRISGLEEVELTYGRKSILACNMRGNGYHHVVTTRLGSTYPMKPGDVVATVAEMRREA